MDRKNGGGGIDLGGGYGIFVRLMRDCGWDFYWQDKYSDNLLARGFEAEKKEFKKNGKCWGTAFEVMEHFEYPIEELKNFLSQVDNLILSTEIYDKGFKIPNQDWWYWSDITGQHISFYSEKTMHYIADKLNLRYYHYASYHIFCVNKIHQTLLLKKWIRKVGMELLWIYAQSKSKAWEDYQQLCEKNVNER